MSAFIEELLEGYTDLELAHHIVSSPPCASTSRVVNLSSNLIAKYYEPSEVEDALKATEVASQLEIRAVLPYESLQLRRFVKILRSVTSPTAGSLATGECRSFWLEDRYGLPANSGPTENCPLLPILDELYVYTASDASINATSSTRLTRLHCGGANDHRTIRLDSS
ncbi:hypothetical protein AARAC_007532 [Aspergillus arachidicola]|uniref:Uncharacterized protein n=1 Tax=Aspergillus arachidicola TaxID=656916 RepID=A0A2G7G0T0_9EURO|nr:hypothetical protein AARAC_007532 [Aspergillus arachidicola]